MMQDTYIAESFDSIHTGQCSCYGYSGMWFRQGQTMGWMDWIHCNSFICTTALVQAETQENIIQSLHLSQTYYHYSSKTALVS